MIYYRNDLFPFFLQINPSPNDIPLAMRDWLSLISEESEEEEEEEVKEEEDKKEEDKCD
jgi:hypothetical protein